MNTQEKISVLRKAREYIQTGWCQGAIANDANKDPIDPVSDEACEWCLIGAVEAAYNGPLATSAAGELFGCNPIDLVKFNDDDITTKADVIRLINAQICGYMNWRTNYFGPGPIPRGHC